MAAYAHCLDNAHNESGSSGFVTLHALSMQFTTNAWAQLRNPNSKLVKALKTHMGHSEKESLDYTRMMMMGLLHC